VFFKLAKINRSLFPLVSAQTTADLEIEIENRWSWHLCEAFGCC